MIDSNSGQVVWEVTNPNINHGSVTTVNHGEFFVVQSFDWQTDATRLAFHRAKHGTCVETLRAKGEIQVKSQGPQTAYCSDNGDLFFVEIAERGVRQVKRRADVTCFALRDDGCTVVVDESQRITLIDAQGNETRIRGNAPSINPVFDVEITDSNLVMLDTLGNVHVVDVTTGNRKLVTTFSAQPARVPYAIGRQFAVSGDVHGQIAVTDLATGTTQRRNLQVMTRGYMTLVLFGVGLAYMTWCFILLQDGVRSKRRRRLAIDAALVVLLPHCMWLGNQSMYVDEPTFSFGFIMFLIGIWYVLLGGSVLFAILYSSKCWMVWLVMAFSFVAIPIAPIALLALLLRWLRWRFWYAPDGDGQSVVNEYSRGLPLRLVRRQFSISGLLLMTAAVAAVIGLVRYWVIGNRELMFAGGGVVVLVFLASLVSFNQRMSHVVLPVSLLLMGMSSTMYSMTSTGAASEFSVLILSPATALFLFAHLRLHHYVPARARGAGDTACCLRGEVSKNH